MAMLETERLRLRQWRDEDYSAHARLNADPMVMRYFPSTLSEQQSHEQADKFRSLIAERGWGGVGGGVKGQRRVYRDIRFEPPGW